MKSHVDKIRSIKVIVCDHCYSASCWQGEFLCDDAYRASTTEKTINELRQLKSQGFLIENPVWWHKSLA